MKKLKKLYSGATGKGGVGKSTAMASLANTFTVDGVPYVGIDCDIENSGKPGAFHRSVPGCILTNPRSTEDLDAMLRAAAESDAEHIICDLPANASGDFLPWVSEILSPEFLDDIGIRFIAVGVVTPEPASVASVLEWQGKLHGIATPLVVLNRREVERVERPIQDVFAEWFRRVPRKSAPVEIEMPALYGPAAAKLQSAGVLPSAFRAASSADMFDARRIAAWGEKMRAAWNDALPKILGGDAQ